VEMYAKNVILFIYSNAFMEVLLTILFYYPHDAEVSYVIKWRVYLSASCFFGFTLNASNPRDAPSKPLRFKAIW
jgi:hypothetical protein